MSKFWMDVILVATSAILTLLLRTFPFIVFGGKGQMPAPVKKVADLLPAAIMGVLVIYCLKGDLLSITVGINNSLIGALVATVAVIGVHLWRRNTLISIAVGTAIYMVLIRVLPFSN